MKTLAVIVLIVTMAISGGTALAGMEKDEAIAKAQTMVAEMAETLKTQLQRAVKEEGFASAIHVCNAVAPSAAEEISARHNARIHRVSLKPRNPNGAPDAYEAVVLTAMDADQAKGELKQAYTEVVTENDGSKSLRFLKPIITTSLCVNCHGAPDKLDPAAVAAIGKLYPGDKAIGYGENQVRGAFSVKVPMK